MSSRGFAVSRVHLNPLYQSESEKSSVIVILVGGETSREKLMCANDVSRGIETEQLEGRWQRGPDFLYLPEREWPQETTDPKKEDKDVEEIMSS